MNNSPLKKPPLTVIDVTERSDSQEMPSSAIVQSGAGALALYTWATADASQPWVVLLHGYPDSAHVWKDVAEHLSKRFRVAAYDVRGAGQSSPPRSLKDLALPALVNDLRAVLDHISPDAPVHLVGHDWGAIQGWQAVTCPSLKGRIASFSTAAPALDHVGLWFQRRLKGPLRSKAAALMQLLSSSYMLFFQLPWVPELLWRYPLGAHWHRVLRLLEGVSASPSPTQSADGRQGLGLYRANLLPRLLRPQLQVTEVPVQLLVMTGDRFVPPHLFEEVTPYVPNCTTTAMHGGHWAMLKRPQDFAQAILTFVQANVAVPV